MKRSIIVVSAVFVVTACSSKDASSTPPGDSGASAVSVPSAVPAPDMSANDISNYTLDMDKMTRWMNVMKAFAVEAKANPEMKDALSTDADASVEQSIAQLEKSDAAQRALKSAGVSTREFVMTTNAYLQAGMTAALLKSTPNYKVPAGQNTKNIDFINQHGAEIEATMKRMEAEMGK